MSIKSSCSQGTGLLSSLEPGQVTDSLPAVPPGSASSSSFYRWEHGCSEASSPSRVAQPPAPALCDPGSLWFQRLNLNPRVAFIPACSCVCVCVCVSRLSLHHRSFPIQLEAEIPWAGLPVCHLKLCDLKVLTSPLWYTSVWDVGPVPGKTVEAQQMVIVIIFV